MKAKTERLKPYLINGKRISQMTRDRLLMLVRMQHEELVERRVESAADHRDLSQARGLAAHYAEAAGVASGQCDAATTRAAQAELERDTALAEVTALRLTLDGDQDRCEIVTLERNMARNERDIYKKESIDNWLKLTTSDDNLSKERARVQVLRRQVSRWAIFRNICNGIFWIGIAAAIVGILWH